MKLPVVVLFTLPLMVACGTTTYVHGNYRFGAIKAASPEAPLPMVEVDPQTFATQDRGLVVVARPAAGGLVLAIRNEGSLPVAIYWRSSQFRVGQPQGAERIASWPAPTESMRISPSGVPEDVAPDMVGPGQELVRSLVPHQLWYVHTWSEIVGNYEYYYREIRHRPILFEKQRFDGGIDVPSHLSNISARQGEEWNLSLDVFQGAERRPLTLQFVVANAEGRIATVGS